MTSMAHYFRRQGRDFVSGASRNADGLWISTYHKALPDSPDMGAEIDAALEAGSRNTAPENPDRGKWKDPMLAVAGVKSNKAWMTGNVAVSVDRDGTTYTIELLENDGRGFAGTGQETVLERPTPNELAAAVEAYLNGEPK